MRVCLDTNVLVSAFATRGLCADVLQLVLTEHQLVLGEQVLSELGRVLRKKLRVPEQVAAEAENLLRREAVVVTDAPALDLPIQNPDDLAVLAQAIAGEAAILVTGDGDFSDVVGHAPVRILTPRGFWEELRAGSGSER